ncbi:DNRLRE domain-containing protein [Sorangium sp. So ce726]|uniref:DNRLRE domain-containing protein n=1 Tax=Sorangium sp. So ce726 TaxID=3133319 RepID=UPI003F5FB300
MRNKTTLFKTICAGVALTSVAGCGVDLGGAAPEGADGAGRAAQALSPGEPVCITVQRGADPGGVADAVLWRRAPRWNDGSNTNLSTGTSAAGGLRRSVLRFDLPVIPAGAEVVSASLSLAQTYKTVDSTVRVHRVTAAWDELTVTWSSFGDAFDPTVAASFTAGAGVGLRSADITALAQAWVSGESANHGVLLEEDPVQSTDYRSSEKPLIEQRPRLDLCYVPRDDAGGGDAGSGGGGAGAPVVVTTPAAGAESSYRRSTIRWEPIAGASSYHLEIDDDPNFRSPEVDTLVTGTSFALGGTALALNGERSWPAYVRINGERWNAGTFAPATVRWSNDNSSLAVGSNGTVYWALVDEGAMSLRTSDDWGASRRLSWPGSFNPGQSALGLAPDGEPWVVWTEQIDFAWGGFYARQDDGYAPHLIQDQRDYWWSTPPLFPADGTVRWAAANVGSRSGYLYTLDGVGGAVEEVIDDPWDGRIVGLDVAVGLDGGLLAVFALYTGWPEQAIVLVDLDDPGAAPTTVGTGYRPSLDVAPDGTIHVLWSSDQEQFHASSADGFTTVTTLPCHDEGVAYRKASRVDAHGTLWFLGGGESEVRLCKSTDAGRTWTYSALPIGNFFALAVGPDDLVHIAYGRTGGGGGSYANSLGAFLATNLTPAVSLGSPAITGQEVIIPAGADDPDGDELSGEAVIGSYRPGAMVEAGGSFDVLDSPVYNSWGSLVSGWGNLSFRLAGEDSWSGYISWYSVSQLTFPVTVEVHAWQGAYDAFVIDAWDSPDAPAQIRVFEEAARASWTGQPALSIPLTGVPSDVSAVLRLSATDGTNTISREQSFGHTGQQTLVLGAPGAPD